MPLVWPISLVKLSHQRKDLRQVWRQFSRICLKTQGDNHHPHTQSRGAGHYAGTAEGEGTIMELKTDPQPIIELDNAVSILFTLMATRLATFSYRTRGTASSEPWYSAAGINTMLECLAKSLFPTITMSRSPYHLFPYKKTSPVKPLGQINLLCDRGNQYHNLVFQMLADSDIGEKLALL